MNRLRGIYWTVLLRVCGVNVGHGLRVDSGLLFKSPPHPGLSIGSNVSLGSNVVIDVDENATLVIGDNVKLNLAVVIAAAESIEIGNDVLIGEFVSVRDADHGVAVSDIPMRSQMQNSSPVRIGNDVWVGRGVAILKGCRVESGAVIAANSVVKGNVTSSSIVGGIPAKLIRMRN